jgi:hypothetical protein
MDWLILTQAVKLLPGNLCVARAPLNIGRQIFPSRLTPTVTVSWRPFYTPSDLTLALVRVSEGVKQTWLQAPRCEVYVWLFLEF